MANDTGAEPPKFRGTVWNWHRHLERRAAELTEYEDNQATALDESLKQSGVDTPDCDCGHEGMGSFWHINPCPCAGRRRE